MNGFPKDFVRRIIDLHGSYGRKWLDGLPTTIQSVEARWKIRVSDPLDTLSYNFVAPAQREDGTKAMLKLGVPGDEIDREAFCLRRFGGNGAAYLLEHDSTLGAMLVERILPGSDIKPLVERAAIEAASSVMRRLHKPVSRSGNFPTVRDWWKGFQRLRDRFDGGTGPLPPELVDEAEDLFAQLASSMGTSVLLHGDLHHENILAGDRQAWIAIDPQGVIGEPAYEIGAFLRNPVPDIHNWQDLEKVMSNRVASFSELLGFDKRRIAGWGFSQAVLSGIWSLEDHGSGWEPALAAARALRHM